MSITLPRLGAKVRITSRWTDGTSATVEGVVTYIPPADHPQDYVRLGDSAVEARLHDRDGLTTTVEVLAPPPLAEPPHGSVVLVTYAHGGFGAFHRDDCGRPQQANRWWGYSTRDPLTWGDLLARGTVTPLVPDPAASGPELPWSIKDEHGDRLHFAQHPDGLWLEAWINDEGNDHARLHRNDAAAAGRALLRWAGEPR